MLSEGRKRYLLPVENILRIEAERQYTIFYVKDGKQYVHTQILGNVEKMLINGMFFRVHRQHIINLREVRIFQNARNPVVTLSDNTVVSIAQRRKNDFVRMLAKLNKKPLQPL